MKNTSNNQVVFEQTFSNSGEWNWHTISDPCKACDLPAAACAACPYGVTGMEPLHPFGRYGYIYRCNGKIYQVLQSPPRVERFAVCLSFDRTKPRLCGEKLSRPHAGCIAALFGLLGCRHPHVLSGKLPKRLQVIPYMCWINADLPMWKQRISHLFFSLAELFVT